jgi:hypothetical protein
MDRQQLTTQTYTLKSANVFFLGKTTFLPVPSCGFQEGRKEGVVFYVGSGWLVNIDLLSCLAGLKKRGKGKGKGRGRAILFSISRMQRVFGYRGLSLERCGDCLG